MSVVCVLDRLMLFDDTYSYVVLLKHRMVVVKRSDA